MAVDSRNKRASVIGVLSPVPRLEASPIGHVQRGARHMAAFLYFGTSVQINTPTFSGQYGSVRPLKISNIANLLQ